MREALAAALGDDTLELAYWVPNQGAYVDADGRPMRIDPAPEGKIATTIEHDGRRVAAIVHAAGLADERELVQTVGAAAALTLENERLDAELRASVAELRASRARIVQAGDEQRRRIERDLHDGAQQRLMALGINLRLLRDQIERDPQDAIELLDASLQELSEATGELRELARGIHPAVLTDRGLAAALNALARRSPVPVEVVETPCDRLPPSIESAAYFVVAEALTNAARYATAQSVTVSVVRRNGQVEIAVSRRRRRRRRPGAGFGTARPPRSGRGARRPPRPGQRGQQGHDPEGADPVRVIVADDSMLVREGVVRLLEEAGFEVVAQAADGEALMRKARAHKPDIAIIDIRMPPTHTDEGLQAALAIREEMPGTGVLVLSEYIEQEYAVELLGDDAAGVGYLLKDRVLDPERFADAVRRVAEGGSALDPEVVSQMLGRRRIKDPLAELTSRERKVLGLMAEGRSNQAIAETLVISERAVEKHVTSIFAKLNLPPAAEDHRRVLAVLAFLGS